LARVGVEEKRRALEMVGCLAGLARHVCWSTGVVLELSARSGTWKSHVLVAMQRCSIDRIELGGFGISLGAAWRCDVMADLQVLGDFGVEVLMPRSGCGLMWRMRGVALPPALIA
jgi:hypothetical protein